MNHENSYVLHSYAHCIASSRVRVDCDVNSPFSMDVCDGLEMGQRPR